LSVTQFLVSNNTAVLAHPLFSWSCSLWLLPISKDQIQAQRSQFCVGRRGESKTDKAPE